MSQMPATIAYFGVPFGYGILLLAFWVCLVLFLTLVVIAVFACIEGGFVLGRC